MIKSEISTRYRELETKIGMLVFTFNSDRRMRGACAGFPDHVIINPKKLGIWFIEVKLGRDVLSARQQLLKWTLQKIESIFPAIRYQTVNEKNFDIVFDEIVYN